MRYVEYRTSPMRRGGPQFVRVEEIHMHRGFRSVYEFDAGTVQWLQSRGHMRELNDTVVYSDTLFMDFDSQPDAANEFKQYLQADQHNYAMFDSGNRSIHFHVELEPMEGVWVPHSQRQFIRELSPLADTSFYCKTGMYRLPGTFHIKRPGQFKKLLESHQGGNLLKIPYVVPAVAPGGSSGGGMLRDPQAVLLWLVNERVPEGGRTPHMFKIMKAAQECGLSMDQAVTELQFWNVNRAYPAHPPEYIQQWTERSWR